MRTKEPPQYRFWSEVCEYLIYWCIYQLKAKEHEKEK